MPKRTKKVPNEHPTLKNISQEFQTYRRGIPNLKACRYPAQLREMVISAHHEGRSPSEIRSAAKISDCALRKWLKKSAKPVPASPSIRKLRVIDEAPRSVYGDDNIILRLEGNGFRVELLTRRGGTDAKHNIY